MLQVSEGELELLAKVICAADDVKRPKGTKPTWRDYKGMATAVYAYQAVQKAHEAT